MNKLKTIWLILTKKDLIIIRYNLKHRAIYPFNLMLPHGYSAHYTDEHVTIRKLNK